MVTAQAESKKEEVEHMAKILSDGSKVSYRLYEKGFGDFWPAVPLRAAFRIQRIPQGSA